MSDALYPAQLPDIEMDEIAGTLMLVADRWHDGLKPGQPVEPDPPEHQANCRAGHTQHPGNHRTGQPLPPQILDPRDPVCGKSGEDSAAAPSFDP